jgi:hypothetical protein
MNKLHYKYVIEVVKNLESLKEQNNYLKKYL